MSRTTKAHEYSYPVIAILISLILVFIGFILYFNRKTIPQTQNTTPHIKTITFSNSGFEPSTVTISIDTRVEWKNKSGKDATVSSDPHPAHNLYPEVQLGDFHDGESLETVFEKPGTYTYHNHFNPTQKGTIIVK